MSDLSDPSARVGMPDLSNVKAVDARLRELALGNDEYAAFNKRIAGTGKRVLGVRMPDMRRLARKLARGRGAADVRAFLDAADKGVYEHVLLAGLLINRAALTDRERIALARRYLKYADSWALIDLFAEKMKDYDRGLWREFAEKCLASKAEYTVRFGVVLLMSNWLDDGSVDGVFAVLRGVRHEGYYVKMALAWLYAEAAVTQFEKTLAEVTRADMDAWTRGKSFAKMLESYRITEEQKARIRALREFYRRSDAGADRKGS
jgi:3-methyladenine DNA glycosylase AlkD